MRFFSLCVLFFYAVVTTNVYAQKPRGDAESPQIFVPDNMLIEANSPVGAIVSYVVEVADNIDPSPSLTCTPASGATFPLGRTRVKCIAVDESRNKIRKGFAIVVEDRTPPQLILPDSITQVTESASGMLVSYQVSATDLVSGELNASCLPASNSSFPVGSTQVQCSAIDEAGREAKGSFPVEVLLIEPLLTIIDEPGTEVVDEGAIIDEVIDEVVEVVDEPAAEIVDEGAIIDEVIDEVVEVVDEPAAEVVDEGAVIDEVVDVVDEPASEVVDEGAVTEEVVDEVVDAPAPDDTVEPVPEPDPGDTVAEEPAPEPEEPTATQTITITWAAPTTRVDGSALPMTELAGYDLFIVAELGGGDTVINIADPGVTEYLYTPPGPDTYHFSISSYDTTGASSDLSSTVTVKIE